MYATTVILVLSSLAVSWGSPYHQEQCNKGAEYWCRNKDTAIECGVLEFCKVYDPEFVKNLAKVDVEPIQIDLYYEAFCGGCRKFILEQLYPAFEQLFSSGIFNIALFPYGNAHEKQVGQKWEFDCQHGEGECQMNLLETCAIHLMSHPQQFMPYIRCVEEDATLQNAKKCADDLHIEWGPISACYNGSEGNYLEHTMAQKTDALEPKHTYVPWIVVDGKHSERMQVDAQCGLVEFLCQHYKGVKPKECNNVKPLNEEKRCYKKH